MRTAHSRRQRGHPDQSLTGVLGLAGCATDDAGAGVRSPRFTRALLAALDARLVRAAFSHDALRP